MDGDSIIIRRATLADAQAITDLVNHFATQGQMLPKTILQVFEHLREFVVAVDNENNVVACGALRLMWHDLAEVRSLAVHERAQGKGYGRRIVEALMDEGREMGLARIFALTYQTDFFARLGFHECERDIFPQKVWLDCSACAKRNACDEIAVMLVLDAARAETANEEARQHNARIPSLAPHVIEIAAIEVAA